MFFYYLYYASAIILIPGIIFSLYAQFRVNSTFKKYSKVSSLSNWTASDMSRMLLEKNGINYVSVQRTRGHLTDNYNPSTEVLSLSDSTYNSNSIAALGVAAHEVGHAVQKKEGYFLLKLRSTLVAVTNIGSRLAIPLAVLGIILEIFATSTSSFSYTLGEFIVASAILAYSLSSIFAFITLPVEFNASKRASAMLYQSGVLTEAETRQANQVLWAAAMTYVASLVLSLLYLLRFILILSKFTRRDD